MITLAQQLEQLANLGIFLVATMLTALSLAAWQRERDRRMLVVSVAYALFMVRGLVVFLEYFLIDADVLAYESVELLEHASEFLVLAGLLVFFFAIVKE